MVEKKGEEIFNSAEDGSGHLANKRRQLIEFYHVPTGQSVAFKAFLTQYSDQYESTWNDEEVYGKMDPISTFKKTSRVISLGWDVVASSIEEAIENLQKCSLLYSMLYPVYEDLPGGSNATSISTSPLLRLKFMNLIQNSAAGSSANAKVSGLLGYSTGFVYEPDLESGFFDPLEIDITKTIIKNGVSENLANENLRNHLFPQTNKLSCNFRVIHEHKLGWTKEKTVRKDFDKFPYASSKSINVEGEKKINIYGNTTVTGRQLTTSANTILKEGKKK